MELTEKRKQELIDLDLDVLNLIKNASPELDTSLLYIRASGGREDDCDSLFTTAAHEQLALAIWGGISKNQEFKQVVFDALINYLSCIENNKDRLLFTLSLIDASEKRENELTIKN
mgnify:CR=1 FL=1|jgi:hypothetical protein|tara:strand:+ start:154 stop:501 length:348 start_codon:yes stop_codon:yes gene_type:complete